MLGAMHSHRSAGITILAAALLCFGWNPSVAQNLLVNGSFETPLASGTTTIHVGDTNLAGWFIGGTRSIYLVKVPLPQLTNAVDGDQFVDLNGANGGVTLSQTFPTEVGAVYDAEFSVGQYQAPQLMFKIQATIIDADNTVLTNREVVAPQSLGWSAPTELRFTATTPTSTLRFTDTNGTVNVDLMLDAVSVRRVTPRLTIEALPVRLCWQTDTKYLYQIQHMSQLSTNSWLNWGGLIPGTGNTICVELPTTAPYSFFRVLVLE
jgi:hypothetical protein